MSFVIAYQLELSSAYFDTTSKSAEQEIHSNESTN
jgi:hypothetical protein